mmetsp:Transcript_16767/g.45826  ORF Transcript_16767/g.45826 Transcript_16767/m.45826 type:complete len:280 (+) Transcript_16767:1237-2076(+)
MESSMAIATRCSSAMRTSQARISIWSKFATLGVRPSSRKVCGSTEEKGGNDIRQLRRRSDQRRLTTAFFGCPCGNSSIISRQSVFVACPWRKQKEKKKKKTKKKKKEKEKEKEKNKEEKEEKEEKMEEGEKEEKKGMENAQEYAMEENAGVANKAKSSDVAAAVAAECDVVMKDEDAGAKRLAEENSECSPPAKVARIAGEGEAAATSGDVAMDADSGATKPAKTDGQQKSADAAGAIEGSGEKSTEEVSGGANKAAETDVLLDSRDEDKRMDVVGGEA